MCVPSRTWAQGLGGPCSLGWAALQGKGTQTEVYYGDCAGSWHERELPAHVGTLPKPFTMRPASTVGTRVSLLPSPTPNSCSFPELSRLGGRKEEGEATETRRGRGSGGRGGGLCSVLAGETGVLPPPPIWSPDSGPWSGGSPSGRGNPMLTVQTPSLKEPTTLDWGTPPLHLTKALFHHPGLSVPRAILSATPRPTLPIIHGLRPRAPLCGTTRLT